MCLGNSLREYDYICDFSLYCDSIPGKRQLKGGEIVLIHGLSDYSPSWQKKA